MPDIAASLDVQGFALVPAIATPREIATLKALFEDADLARAERDGQTYGARNLLGLAQVRTTAALPTVTSCILPILGRGFRTVRGIFFDKTAGANWPVQWHQDLSLAVREQCELAGWRNWSLKRGVAHVQPPPGILDRMITMRLHLDDCPPENGALRVIPGSHRKGQLSRAAIQAMTAGRAETIVAKAGDAVFLRPLILHSSPASLTPDHRRVLHLEFAPPDLLPATLAWAEM